MERNDDDWKPKGNKRECYGVCGQDSRTKNKQNLSEEGNEENEVRQYEYSMFRQITY